MDGDSRVAATSGERKKVHFQIEAAMLYPITWVTVGKYVELTADTEKAVKARRLGGHWVDGLHCKEIDGDLWINLVAVEYWVASCAAPVPSGADVASSGQHGTKANIDTVEAALVKEIVAAVIASTRPVLPISVDLWDTAAIGTYLKRSINRVRSDIVCLPTFPRPIRLPVPGRSQALYKAREVIAWAERQAG
ncbi:hypothetical protein [Massilia eurypsychrophila]|uniref:hypothetical protein n=1 Tax=Massilia eurypsychrophila TaxID=1485217 RepID=UPI001033507E|nr:hypothetical protein [Massilia eurypsychrophila]